MCGIIGIVDKEKGKNRDLTASLAALSKRGPDDNGSFKFPHCSIAQTRLSIIDLATGHQPMKDDAQDIAIIFNGEIYNYKALKKTLEEKGHVFKTQSDTEVILKAYIEYGEKCPEHLDGIFAFGIWDEAREMLFIARDRFGEKPLYYAQNNGQLLFASEIKALLATREISNELDPVSLDNYLSLMYVPPWRSIYKNIHTLPPAHSATYRDGTLTLRKYWSIKREPLNLSLEEAASRIREALTNAATSRMVADVEVGTLLSGGIDSSLVTVLAQQASRQQLKTFSMGFEGLINELPFAAEVAKAAGTEHTEAQASTDLVNAFEEVSAYFDEPFGDSSNVPMHLISSLASKKVKVVLSGDGGDELFWGYGHYRKHHHLPKITKLLNMLTGTDPFIYYKKNLAQYFSPSERRRLLKDTSAIEEDPTAHIDYSEAQTPLEKINLTDFYMGLPGDMLTKVDRASMMHSLEVRSPFLDPALVQLAYNLPAEYKSNKTQGKIILEEAFRDALPKGFFKRKKQGFGAPIGQWLTKPEFRTLIATTLTDDAHIGQWLKMEEVKKYVDRFYAGEMRLQYKVWLLLSLETWARSRTTL